MQQNTANSRIVYENAVKLLQQAGVSVDLSKCTQSDLILEQQAVVNKTQYQFPVLTNNNGPSNSLFNTEIRLNQQDSFIAAAWGFFIAKPSSAIDATFIVQTYPNATVFSTAGVAAAAETLYNSIATIAVNNDIILPVWSLSRHRLVPQSQQVAAAANQNGIALSQIDLSSDGFYPVEPNLLFIGSKNTVINVILPAALAAVEAFQRMRIHYRGVLAQNSTIIT